jgi:alpha-acetolactate decarboxylase
MKKLIGPFVFALILGVVMASLSFAAGDMAAPSTQTVNGDLLKIDGEFYVVKDMAGKEIRLHVDKTTTMDSVIKVGDKVEAQATEKNHAASIKHVQPKM